MGFFRKLFSIGGKKNKRRHEEFTAKPYMKASTLPLLPSKRDSDAAVSRLLRSSSAHFNVVSEVDYSTLPPLPHPINSISRSSISSPSRSSSVQTRNTYTVTVHERVKHSQTEFPNAYPPPDKANASLESNERAIYYENHKSTPNLHEAKKFRRTASGRRRRISDPRKVPFTPRDTNRLNRLRQDPSVVSLLNMYDDKGRLDERAFSNTPRANKLQRESTFKELLALSDTPETDSKETSFEEGEGDFSWAERFIAESNRSCTSLSTISSPPIKTPTLPSIAGDNCKEADTTQSTTESAGLPAISSLEVELSVVYDDDDVRTICDTPEKKESAPSVVELTVQRVMRTPSKRASQVFNFLSEKRERRKSQTAQDMFIDVQQKNLPAKARKGQNNNQNGKMIIPTIFVDEYKSKSIIDPDVTDTDAYVPANPLPTAKLRALQLPMPPPISPFAIHGLPAAPRHKSRSTGAADSLKMQQHLDEREREYRQLKEDGARSTLDAQPSRERLSRATRGSTGAQALLGGEQERLREHEKQRVSDKERLGLVRGPRPLPGASTVGSKLLRQDSHIPVRREREQRVTFGEITNELAETRAPTRPLSKDGRVVRSKVYREPRSSEEEDGMNHISRPKRLGSMSKASESVESVAFANSIGKGSGRASNRTSSSLTAVFELARSSTTSKIEPLNRPVSALIEAPGTPVRSRSLAEVPSPASSSELSPEATQLMADLRAKRMRARYANAQREAELQTRSQDSRNAGGQFLVRR